MERNVKSQKRKRVLLLAEFIYTNKDNPSLRVTVIAQVVDVTPKIITDYTYV